MFRANDEALSHEIKVHNKIESPRAWFNFMYSTYALGGGVMSLKGNFKMS